jgi:tetratricopeptide (TPR) repeat protein
MKRTRYFYLLILIAFVGCRNTTPKKNTTFERCDVEMQMQKAGEELHQFEKIIVKYYNQIEHNPDDVIKQTEILVEKVKSEPDSNNVKTNKLNLLFDLRAETFYRNGEYQHSIREIFRTIEVMHERIGGQLSPGEPYCIQLACNFVKLKDYQKAKIWLDSAGRSWYITDYIHANYYEVIGNKNKALQLYKEIKEDKSKDHYYYYQDALKRIEELNKPNSKLLKELFYPSERTDKDICYTDNERRDKIFNLIYNLPEVKACKTCDGVLIFKEPKETKSSSYWVKVQKKKDSGYVSHFNFYIDTLTFEIKYLDIKNDKVLTLAEWRK